MKLVDIHPSPSGRRVGDEGICSFRIRQISFPSPYPLPEGEGNRVQIRYISLAEKWLLTIPCWQIISRLPSSWSRPGRTGPERIDVVLLEDITGVEWETTALSVFEIECQRLLDRGKGKILPGDFGFRK